MPLLFWEQNQTVVDSLESCSIPRKLLLSDIFCNFVSIHWSFFPSPETNVLSLELPTKLALRRETGVLVILAVKAAGVIFYTLVLVALSKLSIPNRAMP